MVSTPRRLRPTPQLWASCCSRKPSGIRPLSTTARSSEIRDRAAIARSFELGCLHQIEAGDDEATPLVLRPAEPGHRATLIAVAASPAPPPPPPAAIAPAPPRA